MRLIVVPKGVGADVGTPVPVSGLAENLVEEYAELTRGLLRNVAFLGLSILRERAHQLLATFTTETDPAFLVHRALLSEPGDAEGHVLEILSAELLSILEEQGADVWAGDRAIRGWLELQGESNLGEVDRLLKWAGTKLDAWTSVLTYGASSQPKQAGREVSGTDISKITDGLLKEGTEALLGNVCFAVNG